MLSVIIPVFNQHDMTEECLRAVIETTTDYELIIIDNGSNPAIGVPFSGFADAFAIRNEENKGFPAAVNQGIRAAKGDTIILLNNDVIVTPGWAENLSSLLDHFAIVGPCTNYAAGIQGVTAGAYTSVESLYDEAKQWAGDNAGNVVEVNFVIGFCMAFKKSLFDEIGELDESLWPCSGEEIDFCFRAREAGHKIAVAFEVYVHHEGSQTLNDMETAGTINYQELCKRNDEHLAKKWGEDFWRKQIYIDTPVINIEEGIRLNMGCGPFPLAGFINIDQFKSVNPDLLADCRDLPYAPGTVSEIYAGHILEHFRFDDGKAALKYWFSLLKPGGVIGISVPDYDFLVQEYAADPSPEKLIVFNDLYIYSGVQPSPHLYAYSADLLKMVMEEAGFVKLKRMPVDHPYFPSPVKWQCGFMGVKP